MTNQITPANAGEHGVQFRFAVHVLWPGVAEPSRSLKVC